MLRRLFTLILAIACACAPVAEAFAAEAHKTEDCCCGAKCPCTPLPQSVPTSATTAPAPVSPAALEARAAARKPAARQTRAPFSPFLSFSEISPAARRSAPDRAGATASVVLFQAHCSLRI
jgi:hypothetical protein